MALTLIYYDSLSHVTVPRGGNCTSLKVVLNWNDRLKSFVLCIFEHCIVSHDFGHHFIIDDHHGAGEKEASITGWMMFNFPTFTQILQIKMFKNETIFASNNLEQNKFVRT